MKSTIHFSCDHCGQSIEAPKEYQGIVLDCPTCQQKTLCPQLEPVLKRFQRTIAVIFKAAWKVVWIRVVVFLLLISLVGFVFFPDFLRALIALTFLLIFAVLVLCLYFLPSFIAYSRKHLNLGAIFVANLLLGWTFLGWVICLVWALMRTETEHFFGMGFHEDED